jgi:hypothetical protein
MSTYQTHSQISALSNSGPSPDRMNVIGEQLSELQSLAARYSDQVQQAAQTFSERLKLLEEAIAAQSGLPDSITIDAIHPAAETGFYFVEYEASGRPFRWSGPSRDFSFTLKIDRSAPLRLRLHLIALIDPNLQSDLLFLVDGVSVPIRVAAQEEGWFDYEATIPAGTGMRETHLVVAVPCVLQPDNPEDTRLLGVAFRELRIFPVEEASVAETPLPIAPPQDSVADLHESLRAHFPEAATAPDATKRKRRRRMKSADGVAPGSSETIAIDDGDVDPVRGTGAPRPEAAAVRVHAEIASGDGFQVGQHG